MSKIDSRERAPVVSSDSASQEAVLARNAATLSFQTNKDAVYDTVVERFETQVHTSVRLSTVALGLGILFLVLIMPIKMRK